MNVQEWIKKTRDESAYYLGTRAECASPDSLTSPGAKLLYAVRDRFIEELESGRIVPGSQDGSGGAYIGDVISEMADTTDGCGVITFQTHAIWKTFTDLGAYEEDIDDLRGESTTMEQMAIMSLGIIVERLAHDLKQDLDGNVQPEAQEAEGEPHWQWCHDGYDISGRPYAEQDATEKRLWTPNGDLLEHWTRPTPAHDWDRVD